MARPRLPKMPDGTCGAKTKRKGTLCKRPAMENGRCHLHGGKTPKRQDSLNWEHGHSSKYAPAGMEQAFKELVTSSETLTLKNEIALMDLRLIQLVETLPAEGVLPSRVLDAWYRVLHAINNADGSEGLLEIVTLLDNMDKLLKESYRVQQAWMEIKDGMETRRKLVDTEIKRVKASYEAIPVDQAMHLVYFMRDIIVEEIQDEETKKRIIGRFRKEVLKAPNRADLAMKEELQ